MRNWTLPRALARLVLVTGLLLGAASAVQAQPGASDGALSKGQPIRALPDRLPDMTRTEAGLWQGTFGQAVFEREFGAGPASVTVRLAHGRQTQAKVNDLFQRNEADTTTTADGRTVYTMAGRTIGTESADLLWTSDAYTIWMSTAGSSEEGLDPDAAHDALQSLFVDAISPDQLPEVDASPFLKSSMPAADGFEAPDGFATLTGPFAGAMDKEARISVAYPSDWTAHDASKGNPLYKVLDVSRMESAAKARWYDRSDADSDAVSVYAAEEVNVGVTGPGVVTNFIGRIDPMDGIEPDNFTSKVQEPTVVQSPTETTVGDDSAAVMTVTGTSADGYEVRRRKVCIDSNGTVPCVTITRPADRDVVDDHIIRTIVESVTAEVIEDSDG